MKSILTSFLVFGLIQTLLAQGAVIFDDSHVQKTLQNNLDELDRDTRQQQQQNQQYMQQIYQHDRDAQQQQAAAQKAQQDEMLQREADVYRNYMQITKYHEIEDGDQPVYLIMSNGCVRTTVKVQNNKITSLYVKSQSFPANIPIQNQRAKDCNNGTCLEFIFL